MCCGETVFCVFAALSGDGVRGWLGDLREYMPLAFVFVWWYVVWMPLDGLV